MSWPQSGGPSDPYGQQPGYDPYGQPNIQPYSGQPGYDMYAQPVYPAYQAPYQIPGPYGQQTTNGLAIAAMVCGIGGLTMVPLVGSIVGVILGHIARKQVKERHEQGDGMALAGLITGYIGIGLFGGCIALDILFYVLGLAMIGLSSSTDSGYTFVTALGAVLGR